MQPFTLLIKPTGSDCNIDCKYCFYKSRSPEIGQGKQRMSGEVLEKMVADYVQLRFPVSGFAWQGGEPMLMGLDFYKKVIELQKKYGDDGQVVSNSMQTNAILINDDWASFFSENKFLIGISIDGPKELHDYYRKDYSGSGTFDKVMLAIENCKKHKAEFNTLTLVNNKTADHPDQIFDFLVDNNIRYMQFIPCVETDPATGKIADFSVKPQQLADFFCRIFDRWLEFGPEKLSIRDFDSILSFCITGQHTICTFARQCAGYVVIEHKGDCYPCDFFVTPQLYLGNILETPLKQIAACKIKTTFNRAKQNLPANCLVCRYLDICRGGCQKDSAVLGDNWANKQSYFCGAYKNFFDYSMPRFMKLAADFNAGSLKRPQQFLT
jgi:uncharacterized protein